MTIDDNFYTPCPETLEEAVDRIIDACDEKDLQSIKEGLEPNHLHFGLGMSLRNGWNLWHNSVLAQWFKTYLGLGHADDMSAIILESVFAKVKNNYYDIFKTVSRFKKHWYTNFTDPLSLQPISGK